MKKIKSYFLNSSDKYTAWGLIVNWAIILVPIAWLVVTLNTDHIIEKLQEDKTNLKDKLTTAEGFLMISWFLLFVFFCYTMLYKTVRYFWKPKKVRDRKKEKIKYSKDAFWGD